MAASKVQPSTYTYPSPSAAEGKVLSESRHTPHPSKEFLNWQKPPTVSRRRSMELDLDLKESFYHDYYSDRTTGDAGNEVIIKTMNQPAFDASHYIAASLQNRGHDPRRTVPPGLDLRHLGRAKSAQYDRAMSRTQTRQVLLQSRQGTSIGGNRRWSGPPAFHYSVGHTNIYEEDARVTREEQLRRSRLGSVQLLSPPPMPPHEPQNTSVRRPRSAVAKELDGTLNPEVIPAVEEWFASANSKDREIATKMFRTISRGGQTDFTPARPSSKQYQDQVNQAPKKSTARVRVKSANLPSREKREAEIMFKKMPKDPDPKKCLKVEQKTVSTSHKQQKVKHSNSDESENPDWPLEVTEKKMY